MIDMRCPCCNALLQFDDDIDGNFIPFPDCGFDLVVLRQPSEPLRLVQKDPRGKSLWTVPIVPGTWPTPRWLTQVVSGLFLLFFFGFAFALFEHPLALLATAPPLGLILACTLNGIKVARHGRRYTALGVLRIVLVVAVVGMILQPGLGLFTQALIHQYSPGNEQKLREVQQALEERPGDFRCEPARWVLAAGLRSLYKDVWAAFDGEPAAGTPVDGEFRKGLHLLMEDLVRSGSTTLVVQLEEEVDLTEPPLAKIELLLWRNDPALNRFNWTDKDNPLRPKALVDFKEMLQPDRKLKRTKALSDALQKQFGPLLTPSLVSWQPTDAKQTVRRPRISVHGRYKHSGTFVRMGTGGQLQVMPAVSLDVRLHDRTGQLLGQTTLADLVDRDFQWAHAPLGFKDVGPYEAVLTMVYGRSAWEVMRRAGLDAGPAPATFP